MLDTNHTVEVPEGIEINLPIAGPVVRSLAFLIDFIIRLGFLIVCGTLLNYFGLFGKGLMSILFFIVEWFYPVLFEVFNNGSTIGKKSLGLTVVHDDGTPISWSSSMIRNILRSADMFPGLYLTGLVSMFCSSQFKRLGDLAAGTLVIHRKSFSNHGRLPEERPRQPNVSMTVEEQSAIIHFGERSQQLSLSRRNELADLLDGIVEGKESAERMSSILAIANWIRGRR